MPRGDGTGPMGAGPMTGRGTGFCAGYQAPGFINQWMRGGRAWGGRRRGFRNMFYATGLPGWARFGYSPGWSAPMPPNPAYQPAQPAQYTAEYDPEYEKEILKNQADYLKQQLDDINKRLQELKDENKQEGE